MARGSSSKSSGKKEPPAPDKPPFERAMPAVSNVSRSTVTREEAIQRLRALGRNWDGELERLLMLPRTMFKSSGGNTEYYAADLGFGISDVVRDLLYGAQPSPPKSTYGIALYEKASTTYFVFADMERRIIVRERIMSLHSSPPELDWGVVKSAISSAISLAESDEAKSGGLIALFDGTPRLLKPAPAESGDFLWPPRPPQIPKGKK